MNGIPECPNAALDRPLAEVGEAQNEPWQTVRSLADPVPRQPLGPDAARRRGAQQGLLVDRRVEQDEQMESGGDAAHAAPGATRPRASTSASRLAR